jgi:tape measure domain-containing protein
MAERVEYIISLRDLFTPKLRDASNSVDGFERKMGGLSSAIKGFGGVLAGIGVAALAKDVLDTTAKFQGLSNAITFASGSAAEGEKNIKFLRETSNYLGLDLMAATEGFKTFSGAMIGSKLQGEATRQIFESVAMGASAMGLTAEQSEGAFLALGQIMSKGKVQAEELRGQLGERIPGAFQIAARAMGMTTAQLDKFMSDGKLTAEEFLPKFADEMRKTFGGALENSTNSLQSNLNRMNNAFLDLKLKLGQEFLPTIVKVLESFQQFMDFLQNLNYKPFFEVYKELGTSLERLWTIIKELTIGFGLAENETGLFNTAIEVGSGMIRLSLTPLRWLVDVLFVIGDMFKYGSAYAMGFFATVSQLATNLINIFSKLAVAIKNPFSASAWSDAKNAVTGVGDNLGLAFDAAFDNQLKKFDLRRTSGKKEEKTGLQTSAFGGAGIGGSGGGLAGGNNAKNGLGTGVGEVKGTRPTNVNININKLVETLSITTNNISDFRGKLEEEVKKVLLTAVNDVNIIQQ